MNTLDLFLLVLVARVALVTVTTLVLIMFAAYRPAFRHAAGVVGLVLVVISPLPAIFLSRPAWLPSEKLATAELPSVAVAPSITPPPRIKTTKVESVAITPGQSGFHPEPIRDDEVGMDAAAPTPIADVPILLPQVVAAPQVKPGPPAPMPTITPPESIAAGKDVHNSRFDVWSIIGNVLCGIWCFGAIFIVCRDWRRRRELRIVTRSSTSLNLEHTRHVDRQVCSALGLKELPRIHVSDLTPLPFVIGIWKPIVVLPREIIDSASIERLRDVLIHECAHIVRRDPWVHLLQQVNAVLFWFHPCVHWLNQKIAQAREELCDNFVIKNGNAAEYAESLLELAELCGGKRLGLSTLGLFSPRWTLEQRIGGLLDPARNTTTRTRSGITALLVLLISSLSLTLGGIRMVATHVLAEGQSAKPVPVKTRLSVRGKLVDEGLTPLANARVQIMKAEIPNEVTFGPGTERPKVLAETKTDADGGFSFSDIEVWQPDSESQNMPFVTVIAEGREPIHIDMVFGQKMTLTVRPPVPGQKGDATVQDFDAVLTEPLVITHEGQTLAGVVTDPSGQPVTGARVSLYWPLDAIPALEMWSAETDADGKYSINGLEPWKVTPPSYFPASDGMEASMTFSNARFSVKHPGFAVTWAETPVIPNKVNITLRESANIEGTVIDAVTGRSADSVLVRAGGIAHNEYFQVKTDRTGHYRLQLPKDHYNIWAEAADRVSVVAKAIQAVPGMPVPKLDFRLVNGGIVIGSVIDDVTNRPLAGTIEKPNYVAHYGPARIKFPLGRVAIGLRQKTKVNPDGTFRIRVAPGKNYIYFLQDLYGQEQSWQLVSIEEGQERKIELHVKIASDDQSTEIGDDDEGPAVQRTFRPGPSKVPDDADDTGDFNSVPMPNDIAPVEDPDDNGIADEKVPPPKVVKRSGTNSVPMSPDIAPGEDSGDAGIVNDKSPTPIAVKRSGMRGVPIDGWTQELHDDDFDADIQMFALLRHNTEVKEKAAAANGGKHPDVVIGLIPSRQRGDSTVNRLLDQFEKSTLGEDRFYATSPAHDLWLRTIQQIVDLGPAAVPELIEELDATQEPWMLQMLGFTLRAIGDRRAVPALIRAIPKTLPTSETDEKTVSTEWSHLTHRGEARQSMHSVNDPNLLAFAQRNDVTPTEEGQNKDTFNYASPVEEIGGALTRLTGAKNGEDNLYDLEREGWITPMRSKRNIYRDVMSTWMEWWEHHKNDPVAIRREVVDDSAIAERIQEAGGKIQRDGTRPGRPVSRVEFENGNGFSDDVLHLLKDLTSLKTLWLDADRRTQKVFPYFKEFENLKTLNELIVTGTTVTQEGLKGIGHLHNLTILHLGRIRSDGTALKELQSLTNLRKLSVFDIGNDDLKYVAQHQRLNDLSLDGRMIDDDGVKKLRGLTHLAKLRLAGTITDAGMTDLKEIRSLTELSLSYSKITDAGVKELSQLSQLRRLDLSDTKITGEGFAEFKDHQNIAGLTLNNCRITDAGLKAISALKTLKYLYISNNGFTEEGLMELKNLTNLRYLDIKETDLSREAVRELRAALPNLQITDH